jgi:hypothetical protein
MGEEGEQAAESDRCQDCLTLCPWCGNLRWQTRENGCGGVSPDHREKACKKSRRLTGVACPTCRSAGGAAKPVVVDGRAHFTAKMAPPVLSDGAAPIARKRARHRLRRPRLLP